MTDNHSVAQRSGDFHRLNRRVELLVAGILVNACLGSVYSWSVFRAPLEQAVGMSTAESGIPYSVFLGVFAFTMPLAGMLIAKIGSRMTLILGGLLVGAGWAGAGLSASLPAMVVTYGVVGGAGVGLGYGVPLVVAGSWFPARRGLAMGVTLAGFGVSPFITAPLGDYLIGRVGAQPAMIVLGAIFLVVVLAIAPALRRFGDRPILAWIRARRAADRPVGSPQPAHDAAAREPGSPAPPASEPADQESESRKSASPAGADARDLTPAELFRSPRFYGLWSCFAFGTLAGLTAIGMTASFGQEVAGLNATSAALAVSLFGIANGLGRPLFGAIHDAIGTRVTVVVSFTVIAAGALVAIGVHPETQLLFYVSFGILWLMLGGWLALAPAATVRLFGTRNYASNYGIMYTAYGVGALVGGLVSGALHAEYGSFDPLFVFVLVLSGLGIIVALLTLPGR